MKIQNDVDNAEPGLTRREIQDAKLPGFYLVVQPSGTKSFALRYRFQGRQKKLTLGSVKKYSLTDARALAREALVQIHRGIDPNEQKQASKGKGEAPETFGKLAESFLKQYGKKKYRESTYQEFERFLKRDVLPRWGSKRLDSLKRRDVIALISNIAIDRPILANRVTSYLHKMFAWGVKNEFVDVNPVAGIDREPETSRERVLSEDELRAVLKAVVAIGGEVEAYLRLQILLLARRNEIARMAWVEIDFKARVWHLPRERIRWQTHCRFLRPLWLS